MSFPKRRFPTPRLLVSVRNRDEARAAIAGGCDILDVKEPNRGPLGMADIVAIKEVIAVARDCGEDDGVPVSAALGEVRDWIDPHDVPQLPVGVEFVKLGLSGLDDAWDWQYCWQQVLGRFKDRAGRNLAWIAVAYADHSVARAPKPVSIIAAAAQTGCTGVLLDTFGKDGQTLLDWMPPEEVAHLAAQTAKLGMTFAVAGSLRIESLAALADVAPDIIAVRTAACRHGERSGSICPDSVRRFKAAMTVTFSPASRTTD
ncbi:MAG: (5-formylfuran-3-yl)methyl phosphate synthase [Planctomycetaceae bacterium]